MFHCCMTIITFDIFSFSRDSLRPIKKPGHAALLHLLLSSCSPLWCISCIVERDLKWWFSMCSFCFRNLIMSYTERVLLCMLSSALLTRCCWPRLCFFLQPPTSSGRGSPEQRSFRDRQKYFEIDVKQQTPDSKPKPRVSLVGEDDLKKMKEEEG